MAFLKLSDIGKIYTSANNVAVGIRKVNLMFEKGEFVAVTGKSGCGKTTLLNVIGGLDSYEEGEMYIEGRSTSHFSKSDWDEYVSEYISFIFQDYNILESFTVLENIEFALTSIKDLKERRRRALEIADRVGLKDRLKTKGVKLSGGEKQRTVIARAIAKASPIILADEPTGNLDSENAKSILALLKEVSQDKLVIVVTHNYQDIEEYATRHIRIFDGGVESDERFESVENTDYSDDTDDKYARERNYIFRKRRKRVKTDKKERLVDARDKFMLGWKRFVSRPRQSFFISLVLFMALCAIITCVSISTNIEYKEMSRVVNNMEGRVIVASKDRFYTQEDAQEIADKYGANSYLLNDVYLDQKVTYIRYGNKEIEEDYPLIGFAEGKKVDKGRLPTAIDEVALKLPYNYANKYSVGDKITIVKSENNFQISLQGYECTIVGIDLYVDNRQPMELYFTKEGYDAISLLYSIMSMEIKGAVVQLDENGNIVLKDPNGYPLNNYHYKKINIRIDKNLEGKTIICNRRIQENCALYIPYLQNGIVFKDITYDRTLKFVSGLTQYNDDYDFVINISPEYFAELVSIGRSEQISLMFDSDKSAKTAVKKMTDDGYTALAACDVQIMIDLDMMTKLAIFITTTLVLLVFTIAISLIAISTLIKLMSLSRGDVAVFRTMGIKDSTVKASTFVHLFISIIPAIILMTIFVLILYYAPFGTILGFMGWDAVFMLVACIAIIIVILSSAYNKLLYKNKIKKGLRRANK